MRVLLTLWIICLGLSGCAQDAGVGYLALRAGANDQVNRQAGGL